MVVDKHQEYYYNRIMNKKKYIGKKIHIVSIMNNIDVYGVVTSVDSLERFHGTWGDYVPDTNHDYITLEE